MGEKKEKRDRRREEKRREKRDGRKKREERQEKREERREKRREEKREEKRREEKREKRAERREKREESSKITSATVTSRQARFPKFATCCNNDMRSSPGGGRSTRGLDVGVMLRNTASFSATSTAEPANEGYSDATTAASSSRPENDCCNKGNACSTTHERRAVKEPAWS